MSFIVLFFSSYLYAPNLLLLRAIMAVDFVLKLSPIRIP